MDRVGEVGLDVERGGHRPLDRRAGRGQGAELASEVGGVHVGVVALNAAVADGEHVASLDLDSGAVGVEPFEAGRAVEGADRAPADDRLVPLGDDLDDLQLEVREGAKRSPNQAR